MTSAATGQGGIILVTGANGYLGGLIVAGLRRAGRRVLLGGRFPGADVMIDLDDPDGLERLTFPQPIWACIHTAAANEVVCRETPRAAVIQNVLGTRAILNACVRQGAETFIYLSTFHVFGHSEGMLDEDALPQPVDDYGLSHWQAEQYVDAYFRLGRISGTIVRPANVFGLPVDWQIFNRWSLAPFDFCRQAVRDGEIVLRGSGRQRRSFISGEFLTERIIASLSQTDVPLVHLAGTSMSILEWAVAVRDIASGLTGRSISVRVGPPGNNEVCDFAFVSRYGPVEKSAALRDDFIERTVCHLLGRTG